MEPAEPGTRFDPREIRDFWPRLLASPIIGAVVVNLSGLIDHRRHTGRGIAASYAWFAFVAFVIWEGNRRLYFRLQRREDWLLRPWRRLGLLLTVIVVYTIPVAAGLLWAWRAATGDPGTRPHAFATALLAVVALVIAIAHAYETVFLLRDWESDRLRRARTEQARLQTELESLGRDVDAHFLFNNLHALGHLVEERSDAAPGFIRTLSATYRYVLECRGRMRVPLSDEIDALRRHKTLADLRYPGGVTLEIEITADEASRWELPPVSLGELFHNALKHNTVTPERPLRIRVRLERQALVFENDARAPVIGVSTGLGLPNLRDRFLIGTGRAATWGVEHGRFVVRLPLVPRAAGPAPGLDSPTTR